VQSGDEKTVFGFTNRNIDALIKEVGSAMTSMKALGDNIIMTGEMSSALGTRVYTRSFEVDHGVVFGLSSFGCYRICI